MKKKSSSHKEPASLLIILGNQLFLPKFFPKEKNMNLYLAEDEGLCTHFKYHQQKIVLFLSAMRHYAAERRKEGYQVFYQSLNKKLENKSYEEKLQEHLAQHSYQKIYLFEIEDKFMEERLFKCFRALGVDYEILTSPMFLCSREHFNSYLKKHKRPFMKSFYEAERKRRNILLEASGKPLGGRWSYDVENRKPLPKDWKAPSIKTYSTDSKTGEVMTLVQKHFSQHPGKAEDFWAPVTRKQALAALQYFLKNNLKNFGDYEDALQDSHPFLYHSVLSPVLNLGLLTPQEVIDKTQRYFEKNPDLPLAAVEGFIRQVMGWREFIRGIYQNFDEVEQKKNFWKHSYQLGAAWYEGSTGIPPLDAVICKVLRWGYNHHIERLMVLSNMMLLCEIHPQSVYQWFMEMYIDSSDWVMGPNVFGMGQFSDGGIFATKPYICGSNYWRKMGRYEKASWCDVVDGLYWRFIRKHREFFAGQPRFKTMIMHLDKMDTGHRKNLDSAAQAFLKRPSIRRRAKN